MGVVSRETIKNSQIEVLELKNIEMFERKKIHSVGSITKWRWQRSVSEFESIEIIQSEEQTENGLKHKQSLEPVDQYQYHWDPWRKRVRYVTDNIWRNMTKKPLKFSERHTFIDSRSLLSPKKDKSKRKRCLYTSEPNCWKPKIKKNF